MLGSRCPGCARPGRGLCAACGAELAAGRIGFAGRDPSPPGFPLTVAGGAYAGILPALIAGFKDERLLCVAAPMAERLAGALEHLLAALGRTGVTYALVPVPSARAAVRERGLDHTRVLALRASRIIATRHSLRLPVRAWLRASRTGQDQVGLDAEARWANRRQHFRVRAGRGPADRPILVDDVTTTGATLAGAATALERAGLPPVGAVVVAATVRRRSPHVR